MDKHVITCEICGSGEIIRFWRLLPRNQKAEYIPFEYYAWCHDCFHWEDSKDPSVLKVSKEEYLASRVLDE